MAHEDEQDRTCAAVPVVPPPGDRHAFLLVLSGPSFGELFALPPGRDLTVGRREDADVPLRDDGISRRHALVRVEGDTATVRDLGSVNGTWVNGKRLPEARIEHGARLHLGTNTTLQYLWVDELEVRHGVEGRHVGVSEQRRSASVDEAQALTIPDPDGSRSSVQHAAQPPLGHGARFPWGRIPRVRRQRGHAKQHTTKAVPPRRRSFVRDRAIQSPGTRGVKALRPRTSRQR